MLDTTGSAPVLFARLRYNKAIRDDKEITQWWYEQCEEGQFGNDQKEALPLYLYEVPVTKTAPQTTMEFQE